MKNIPFNKVVLLCLLIAPQLAIASMNDTAKKDIISPAREVMARLIGERAGDICLEELPPDNGLETFSICSDNGKLTISGSSTVALCYAFNTFLKEACGCMITWGGMNMKIPEQWPDYVHKKTTTPYRYRYYLNVVTYGYTTPYWDWERWEREIDWMALHGINMPLATVASEAIAERVWLSMGLRKEDIVEFFTGPAHLPWHRMGNLNGWDGPLTDNWHAGQVRLQHQIIERMRYLGFEPVAPAFAGFVPESFLEKHPEITAKSLTWGGFPKENNAFVLPPDSPWFLEIGKRFITEWEKEFGKNKLYLSDSFNEMELPAESAEEKNRLLEKYGESIYKSIIAGNNDAIWVTQGWTFGYQYKFWDRQALMSLLKNVPDDKMIIIDLANDYPKWIWHTDLTWKTHEGFYGKKWIFSYTPNFGGKTAQTGELSMYATYSALALHSPYRNNLVGFGSAPEGIENNEVIYELIYDMGWQEDEIDLDRWLERYCIARYGGYPEKMKEAWSLLRKSSYSSLYSYTRYLWQTVVPDNRRKSRIDTSDTFMRAVVLFLSCANDLKKSELYRNDAIELASLYLSTKADSHYLLALKADSLGNRSMAGKELNTTVGILLDVDKLLASHPSYQLRNWVEYARKQGTTPEEQMVYEANAKRLITTWGGYQADYSARLWSGLIKDYYVPRIVMHITQRNRSISEWEEEWISTKWQSTAVPFDDPVEKAISLVLQFDNSHNNMPQ